MRPTLPCNNRVYGKGKMSRKLCAHGTKCVWKTSSRSLIGFVPRAMHCAVQRHIPASHTAHVCCLAISTSSFQVATHRHSTANLAATTAVPACPLPEPPSPWSHQRASGPACSAPCLSLSHRLVCHQRVPALVNIHGHHSVTKLQVATIRLHFTHDHAEQGGLTRTVASYDANHST